ncbi:MAG TPA: FecR domain-containing protein [Kiritimatiellia bacterium]|nr:FecR domain-containing protein [Kiritimatiellia bacterium]HNS80604.1 FecR domain-containing protein [Kiritimatiellia bacterium]HPA78570.1 FecR domain-containing protein [Kiritimatiellia bacterium]HQQ03432.1 FecR domain-containing protein [Kiritimatiellia bacterium]
MKTATILMLAAVLFMAAGVLGAEPIGKVISLQGSVTATEEGGTERHLKIGSAVFQNDIIKTGPQSKVQLMFTDDTLFAQGAESEAHLTEYIFTPDQKSENAMGMKLGLGMFRVITGKITDLNPDRFRVKTGRATIGIRGCELGFVLTRMADRVMIIRVPSGREIIIDEIRDFGDATGPLRSSAIRNRRQGIAYTLQDGERPAQGRISSGDLLDLFENTTPGDAGMEGGSETFDPSSSGQSNEENATGETPSSDESQTPSSPDNPPPADDSTTPAPGDTSGTDSTPATGGTGDSSMTGNESFDPVVTDPTIDDPSLDGWTPEDGTTTDPEIPPSDGAGTVPDPTVPPPPPTTLMLRGGGIGGTYLAGVPHNELQDVWIWKQLNGTMDNTAFDGQLLGMHDNFFDSQPSDSIALTLNVPLQDFMPGSTIYDGHSAQTIGGATIDNDNLLQFWTRVDSGDHTLALSYGGFTSENYAGAALPADSVIRYDILFTEFPPLRPTADPLTPVIENGTLWVNTRTGDFMVDPAMSPGLQGSADWLTFFGQEMQGVGHVGIPHADTSGNLQPGGMCLAGFLNTSPGAVAPADTGTTIHNGGYAVGASFCEFPAGGSPVRAHAFYSGYFGESSVSLVVNRDSPENNALLSIAAFQGPSSQSSDMFLTTPHQSFYVMDGLYEASYSQPNQLEGVARGDVDSGGTDWGWGEWNGTRTTDYGDGPQEEMVEGRYVTGTTLTPAAYDTLFQGSTSFDLVGAGSASGYIGNNDYRSRVDGSASIHVQIPGGGAPANWDGTFQLSNANGDVLNVSYSPLSLPISSSGNLTTTVTPGSYVFQAGGAPVASPLIEHRMDGSLVGPGTGAIPITGAIGSGLFRHMDGHFAEFTYGTDLH